MKRLNPSILFTGQKLFLQSACKKGRRLKISVPYVTLYLTILPSLLPILIHAQNPGDNVFAGIQVHIVKIYLAQTNYWDSLTYYYNQGKEQYMAATLTLDGVEMDSVGVRLKGNASYSHPNNKKPIKLSFDEYIDGQKWDGLKAVHLNNCWGDPSFMREKMHLDFCKDAGIPAPRGNYAMVYINDVVWGLYSLVEHVDKKFLNTHYGNKDGNLYKAIDPVDGTGTMTQLRSDFKWYGSDTSYYTSRYELKTDEAEDRWGQLISFINTLNNSTDLASSLPAVLNTTNFYRAISTDILFANLDSYIDNGSNFYFYFNPSSNKLEWIVWDASLSFGAYSTGNTSAEKISITCTTSSASRPLTGNIFNNADLKNDYLVAFSKLFNNYFNSTTLFAHIDSIASIIRTYVNADTKKQYTTAQFESNISSDITGSGMGMNSKIPGLKSFITSRISNVQSQLASLNIDTSSTISTGDIVINEFMAKNKTTTTDPAGEYDDWIELYNNTNSSITLGGFYLSDSFSQQTKWQFPDSASIPAKGYLIVWADEDTGQTGLHASFKLSDSGEEIILSDANLNVIDSVTFGELSADYSIARIPNGTGSFVQTETPTPGTINDNTSSAETASNGLPKEFSLAQNYPNPFNPSTTISFNIPKESHVKLEVFDILGKCISIPLQAKLNAGSYQVSWKANAESSGIYFYRLSAQSAEGKNFIQVKKMLLLK